MSEFFERPVGPPAPTGSEEPPETAAGREQTTAAERDTTPALGKPGEPGRWRRSAEGATVALARRAWGDARWSFLYRRSDTSYQSTDGVPGPAVQTASRRMRGGALESEVHGPIIKAPVWTWEVPLYFWFGGIAAGSSFVALACDLSGDHRSAATARKVSLGALAPCPPLLILDLGRPARFLNMLRVFKPRSPMSLGAWCLSVFGGLMSGAVGADLIGRRREAQALGGASAVVGGYLGSYTGVLLATTAVPLWARSRLFLGPAFVATATATGAAATRLALVATGVPSGHPTRTALGRTETGAMAAELILSTINEHRLGDLARVLEEGRPGRLFTFAKWCVRVGLTLRWLRPHGGVWVHHVASTLYLLAGLAFRYAWVQAGQASARDDALTAEMARGQ